MIRKAGISFLLVLVIWACDKDNGGGSDKPAPVNPPTSKPGGGDSNDQTTSENPADPGEPTKPSIGLGGNTLTCRVDESDGKEYCFDPEKEMPSDTNPEAKVQRCEQRLLDNDVCKSISVVYDADHFAIYAGETQRVLVRFEVLADPDTSNLPKDAAADALVKSPEVRIFDKVKFDYEGNLIYDYPTKYQKQSDIANVSIKNSYGLEITQINRTVDYEPIAVTFDGHEFKTGPMKLDDFKGLCQEISSSKNWTFRTYDFMKGTHVCGNDTDFLQLSCDDNDQHCEIAEMRLR